MRTANSLRSEFILVVILLVLGIFSIALGSQSRAQKSFTEATPTLMPPRDMRFFTLGYSEIIADLLWLRVIQDFDYCENRKIGDIDPAKFKCERGWVFSMIDAVTEIAPSFMRPYFSGALMLTVIVNDVKGASVIFDKGVARFPNNWSMLYNASYQAMLEEKNPDKAADLLLRAGRLGAPKWVFSLAARLRQKTGELELAKSIMLNAINANPDDSQREYFEKRLAEIELAISHSQADAP